MLKKLSYVVVVILLVGWAGVVTMQNRLPIGPVVLLLGTVPLAGLVFARRSIKGAAPDMLFGAIDTALLTVPALWGGVAFGVAGAIAGSVIGDSMTDAIAGFAEGQMADWLRSKGVVAAREPVTTGLGKMTGCLLGSGVVLTVAYFGGIHPTFK